MLLKSRQPILISKALQHIVGGSGLRFVEACVALTVALSIGWIAAGAVARAAVLEGLLDYFGRRPQLGNWHFRPLVGLNFLRTTVALAAMVGFLAALLVGAAASSADDRSFGMAFLVTFALVLLVWLAWSGLNWFLSLASIFVVNDALDTFSAIAAATDFCQQHVGPVLAAGTWFGLAHFAAFVIATVGAGIMLGSAAPAPAMATFGLLLLTLFYFAVVDFLYVGRLAAYVAMLDSPEITIASLAPRDHPPSGLPDRVDPDELILSDLPAQA